MAIGKPPKVPFPKGQKNPASRSRRKKTGAGRRKGVQNKWTRDMREAILNAFEKLGGENYLVRYGRRDFRTMGGLLRAVIPQEIKATIHDPEETAAKIREKMGQMDQTTSKSDKEKGK